MDMVQPMTSLLFSFAKGFSLKCQYYIFFSANKMRHAVGKSQDC